MMQIVRLEDGSIGFVDKRRLSKVFGAFFFFIGALPVPALFKALTEGLNGMHPVAVGFGAIFMVVGLLVGICFLNNWSETWVMLDTKQVHVRSRFGFWKTDKVWTFSEGGVVKPWLKCTGFTSFTTVGLRIEAKDETFEVFVGDATALPTVMHLGPHLAKLLGITFQNPDPISEVQIYPAEENRPEGFDPTHFYEELPNKGGWFFVGFGLLLAVCGLSAFPNVIVLCMTLGPAALCIYFGLRVIRKFSQLKIDIEKQNIVYRWRNFLALYTEELPLDAVAGILVTYYLGERKSQSKYYVALYFAEYSIPLFNIGATETTAKEVQEKAWGLASQLGCPMFVALNRTLEASERLVVS